MAPTEAAVAPPDRVPDQVCQGAISGADSRDAGEVTEPSTTGSLSCALVDYYRCPAEFFPIALAGSPSPHAGFFRLGTELCYGGLASGNPACTATGPLHDALPSTRAHAGVLHIPFDPSRAVDNLRLERYAGAESLRESSWQRPYYSLRRFIPPALRRTLQRTYMRDWRRLRFPRWPVDVTVDRLVERLAILALRARGADAFPFVWFWPDGAPGCAIVTHDVETAAGRDRCTALMDLDEGYGLKASFQLVPEDRYALAPALLDEIRARGFEINVHDVNHDGRLFSSREEFARRAERINGHARALGARGFRSGSLHRRLEWLHSLDVAYDMSVPNVGHLEIQRGGCCTVMPYLVGDLVELPLTTTQDYSLFHVLNDFSGEVWRTQLEAIRAQHGLASFIVHPDYVGTDRTLGAYRALLERLSRLRDARQCWVALPGDVERWWRQRSRMTISRDGDGWRVEGEGAERARLAYAAIEGDRLVYRVQVAVRAERERRPA